MKRQIALLVGTFILLLGGFLGYRALVRTHGGDPNSASPGRKTVAKEFGPLEGTPGGDGAQMPKEGEAFRITQFDGARLSRVYEATRWNKGRDEYTYELVDPRFILYLDNGMTLFVRADEGTIETATAGAMAPRRINLRKNVQIDFDRNKRASKPPLDERPEDRIRLLIDTVEFDNELLTVRSSSDLEVHLTEADIYGRGLLIRWTDQPRELEIVRIDQGDRLVVRNVPRELDVVALPGAEEAQTPGGSQAPEATAGTEPKVVDAGEVDAAEQPAEGRTPARNIFEARFFDDVEIVSDQQSIHGSRQLALVFEWDRAFSGGKGKSPADQGPDAPADEGASDATAPALSTEPAPPASAKDMVITWSGPLVLEPVGYTPRPSRKRYKVSGAGDDVVLTKTAKDGNTQATCKEFDFARQNHPTQPGLTERGQLVGTRSIPATLTTADGMKVICERMRFDRLDGKAHLDGPGEMIGTLRQGGAAETQPAEADATPVAPDRIAWSQSVVAGFSEQRRRASDGTVRARQVLDNALFVGDVHLTQGKTGDWMKSGQLETKMAHGETGKVYPREAIATGGVTAHQQGSDVSANFAKIVFEESNEPAGEDGKVDSRVRPRMLTAEGDVRIVNRPAAPKDPNNPEADVLVATGDRIESDLVQRRAVLFGRKTGPEGKPAPAHITQGANAMEGQEIRIYEIRIPEADEKVRKEYEVRVNGPGNMRFLTTRDLDSHELKAPREINIAWREWMTYRGQQNTADFSGAVALNSGTDHMTSKAMHVLFESVATDAPAAQDPNSLAPDEPKNRGLALNMEDYSRRRLAMVRAEEEVVLWRREDNEQGQVLRRYQLAGPRLVYDAKLKRMTISGAGTMTAENYEPPDQTAKVAADGTAAPMSRLQTPAQTAMKWSELMQYDQAQRSVTMTGDVNMVHAGGSMVKLVDRFGDLKDGRMTTLRGETAMVEFAPPAEKPDASPDAPRTGNELDLGRLRRFVATRNVNIQDRNRKTDSAGKVQEVRRQVFGQRVVYDNPPDQPSMEVVTIWGFLEGDRPTNAQLIQETLSSATRTPPIEAPKIVWFRQDDRIVVDKVTGGR